MATETESLGGAICGGGDYHLGRNAVTFNAPWYDPLPVLWRNRYERQESWRKRAGAWARKKGVKLWRSMRQMIARWEW